MAYAKKQKKKFKFSNYDFSKLAKRIFTVIIVFIMLLMILFVLFQYFNSPEKNIKQKIETIAANYYETQLYAKILNYSVTKEKTAQALEKYQNSGFSTISLRQFFLDNPKIDSETIDDIKNYCDEDNTYVKFFPQSPYGQKDYYIDYHYSCSF